MESSEPYALSPPKDLQQNYSTDSKDLCLYLVDVQGLHGVFYQLNVDLCLFWLKLLVRNELGLWKKVKKTRK